MYTAYFSYFKTSQQAGTKSVELSSDNNKAL